MAAPRFANVITLRPTGLSPAVLSLFVLSCAGMLALGACQAADPVPDPTAERDPAAAAALNDPIMVDPDLASQNRGNSALSGGGPAQGDLPDFVRTREEAATARTMAQSLLGSALTPAPGPVSAIATSRLDGALTVPALVTAAGIASPACADQLTFTMTWAAKLPAGLPVYPRGHAVMAAGSDGPGCNVRGVRFVTPVSVSDATDFYYASAHAARLPVLHRREGNDEVIAGVQGSASYAVYIRDRGDGLTEIDLLTAGL